MLEKVILFSILAILWVMVVLNNRLRRSVKRAGKDLTNFDPGGAWGTENCSCGTARDNWKPLAMNRPDNTLLLLCPQCKGLWEESMSLYGNRWRVVGPDYAKIHYGYKNSDKS